MVRIYDNVLSEEDFWDYKARLMFARFKDVESQGKVYADISQDISADKLYLFIQNKLGPKPENVINFNRAYRKNSNYPTWIHSDAFFSDYIAIFFVQPSEFIQDDAFALWEHKDTGSIAVSPFDSEETKLGFDNDSLHPEKWKIRERIEFKENRLVICPASYFHSCATYGHHGDQIDKCRIVHVLFFNCRN